MKRMKRIAALLIAVFGLMVILGAFFIVSETEQAVILQLGNPVRVIVGDRTPEEMAEIEAWMAENAPGVALSSGAGLYFKIPLLQQVRMFDDRILDYDDPPADMVTMDKKHVQIDCYARWRIQNPLLFLRSVQSESGAMSRLDDIIYSMIRQEVGRSNLIHLLRSTNDPIGLGEYVWLVTAVTGTDTLEDVVMDASGEIVEIVRLVRMPMGQGREALLSEVTEACREMAASYGIHILDVRIKRVNLPPENQAAVFSRMQAERYRISTRYRAEGMRMSNIIIANTDLQVDSILARASRLSLTLQGVADSTAAAIYAEAYGGHADFYRFSRSLETLENILDDSPGRIVVGTDGIFEYLVSEPGRIR